MGFEEISHKEAENVTIKTSENKSYSCRPYTTEVIVHRKIEISVHSTERLEKLLEFIKNDGDEHRYSANIG